MLAIQLLGQPQILLDGQPLNITRRKSRAIVYYLAAHEKPLSREHLLAFFWPDLDRPAAQQTLRTTLHGLRKTLGPALLVADDKVGLEADVDVRRFFASSSQSPREASNLQLYCADFLDGFTLPDSPAFGDWAAVERERYRRLAVRGLTRLSALREADGNFAEALEALERALAFDALQEDLQRAAMRLHYLAGDRAAAIRRYDSLRRLLDEEMGVPPMAETRALYDSIITDKLEIPKPKIPAQPANPFGTRNPKPQILSPAPRTAAPLPFTGRDSELQILRGLVTSHRLALIEGEPGIGKTRLAEEFINSETPIALVGVAHELEHTLPYQPLIDALRGLLTRADWPALLAAARANLPPVWLTETARLLPELGTASPEPPAASPADESRLWEGLHQFLLALARQHPVVLFLDDLQWADASSLALLGYLIRQSQTVQSSVFYLAAARPAPPRSPLATLLQTLTREERLTRLTLQRLNPGHVADIANHLSPANIQFAEWLGRVSEGNPYVLAELVRYATERDLLNNLSALADSPVVPQTIYSLIQSRLSRLSDPARRVLDAAVAAGRDFDFEVVYHAAGLSESAALDALDELLAATLVRPDRDDPSGRLYIFDHTLTMEVAYREVGEARHRLLHHRIAETLEGQHSRRLDSMAGIIASHFLEGNDPDRAAPYAWRAGQHAAGLAAWKEAVAFFEQALAAQAEDNQRRKIYMELGEVRFRAGEGAQASEAFRSALALSRPDSAEADEARLALARSFLLQARFGEILDLLKQVRAVNRPDHAAQAEFIRGTALSIEGADLAAAAEYLQKAESILNQLGEEADVVYRSQVKFEMGSVAAQQGDLQRAVALYKEALTIAEQGDPAATLPQRILARNNLAYHLHLLGDPTAVEHARAGLALAQEQGGLSLEPFLLSTLGEIALAAEEFETAERYFEDGLALAEQLSIPERITGLTANLGLAARATGQTDLAIHHLSTALARADSLGLRHLAAQTRLWLAPLLPPAEAHARLAEARAIAEASGRRKLLEQVGLLEVGS
ncbi:MAG: AAA family ATPase [Chloroflexi bacterium]|nr:AAA family ATPase [Chloroflexota bacterium]